MLDSVVHVAQMHPLYNTLLVIVAFLAAITVLVKQAGNLAAALEDTVRKLQHLLKVFRK